MPIIIKTIYALSDLRIYLEEIMSRKWEISSH